MLQRRESKVDSSPCFKSETLRNAVENISSKQSKAFSKEAILPPPVLLKDAAADKRFTKILTTKVSQQLKEVTEPISQRKEKKMAELIFIIVGTSVGCVVTEKCIFLWVITSKFPVTGL
ncbi:hypothetical protein M9H77_15635 [Catharanthus roseus]|uniref:Uncharacterized protein n=1 Tax=Catharanthus roseus TaxID=4058 RepID=A0ACC0AZ98_CATRO|nr:hypothetical protein M9H77_15635 [Catharanthus roseus]